MGKQCKQWETLFFGAPKSLEMVITAMKLKDTCSLEDTLWPTSVQFSCSIVSDSLQPHGLQHARLPCPITNSRSLLKLMSIKSVMPSKHLILCCPLLLLPSTNLDSILKSRDITLPTKVHLVKAMVFPAVMYGWELDHKESWVLKNWCFWTVVLEKPLSESLRLQGDQTSQS